MTLNTRQIQILDLLKTTGYVEVEALSKTLSVTTQTVRRDLADLVERGLATRTHGGAKRHISTAATAYEERRQHHSHAKQAIGEAAARLIPDGASVALNIGTTTEHVAQSLRLHRDLTVLTNSLNILHILKDGFARALIVAGGEMRPTDGAIIGEEAVASIARYKVDYAIFGASSLDADGSVLDFDSREVAVARALLANTRTKILVCDSSKFTVSAPHRICALSDLDHVVTDTVPPHNFVTAAQQVHTNIIVAGEIS